MGNYNACTIVGIGYVKIKMYDETTRTLEHVKHVPILSVRKCIFIKKKIIILRFKSY